MRFVREEINILDPRTNEYVTYTINDNPEIYLEKPELVKTISCLENQEWSRPWNISSVDDDCVLLSVCGKDFITMAYNSEKPSVKIQAQYGCVKGCPYLRTLFKDSLYTAYKNFITKRTFNKGTPGPEVKYNPNISDIWSIKVLNESSVLLLSHSENKITEYNPNSNQTRIVVSNLKDPVHVNIIWSEGEVLYLVTCRRTHSVELYDDGWKLVHTFGGEGQADGQMIHPEGTTFTKQSLLIAQYSNHRISLFSRNGEFIKHVLTSNDGIVHPMGLSYTRPFLWLSQRIHLPLNVTNVSITVFNTIIISYIHVHLSVTLRFVFIMK